MIADPIVNNHIILYAKGHYIKGLSTMEDMKKIFFKLEQPTDWETIIETMSQVALSAIRKAQPVHHVPNPDEFKKKKSSRGLRELAQAKKSVSPNTEYSEQMLFMIRSLDDMLEKYGPKETDFQEDVIPKSKEMLVEIILQSMLVPIARWNVSEEEIGKPDKRILSLRSPEKQGGRYEE